MTEETIYSQEPFVATYSNIITDEECDHIINISKGTLSTALVSSTTKGMVSAGRTGTNTWLSHTHDIITTQVGEKIARTVGLPIENAEKYQVVHYDVSQQYKRHYDSWDHNGSDKTIRCMKYGGSRLITALVYLNNVEEGGGTQMTKLGITIKPEKGKMLVFHNTHWKNNGSNEKHELSEHAALPVTKGEKYAFNLWFKECNSKMLYSLYNPKYYNEINNSRLLDNEDSKTKIYIEDESTNDTTKKLHNTKHVYTIHNFIENISGILDKCSFTGSRRKNAWVRLNNIDLLVRKIENRLKISRNFYENMNVVEYSPGDLHGKHFVAYDLDTENGKKYTENTGQRMLTITAIMSDNMCIKFPFLDIDKTYTTGDVLIYKNTLYDSNIRDPELERTIVNNDTKVGYIANIYVREYDKEKNKLYFDLNLTNEEDGIFRVPCPEEHMTPFPSETSDINLEILECENYETTLQMVLDKFYRGEIGKSWIGYESFKYLFRGDFNKFTRAVNEFRNLKYSYPGRSCLRKENLEKDYVLDPEFQMAVVNNVLEDDVLKLFQKFYEDNIVSKTWNLGDRQAQRYKCHNEAMSRFLHYETLPLIEKITGKKLKPSYTYLSLYVEGADLPGHTDREECEYTVSFVVDKPKNSEWNIFVDKNKQPVKYKGRYPKNPPKEQCVKIDCDAGGLMMFQGTDRIHFREKLKDKFYNIILLHYIGI